MKLHEMAIAATIDLVRVNYECAGCDAAYTEQQYTREIAPACGHCGGALSKLTLVVARREQPDA